VTIKRAKQVRLKHYQKWEKAHSHLSAVQRKYWRKRKQELETTSLGLLIK
jgi:hypothetical protein